MKNIIVVDMQKGFINDNNNHIVEKINNYLNNNKFDNVFYTRYINYPESPFVKILSWNAMQGKEEQEFVVDVLPNSTIFTKTGYGLTSDMLIQIKNKNITEIEVCGTDTDACVMAIAYNLFDENIKPIILADMCASSSSNKDINNDALLIMKRSFGKINVIYKG